MAKRYPPYSMETVRACCIRAVHRFDWPSAAKIADEYHFTEQDTLMALRELKGKRLLKERRRDGERQWAHWERVR